MSAPRAKRSPAWLWLFLLMALMTAGGVGLDLAAQRTARMLWDRPGASAMIGAGVALALALAARLLQLVLGRPERRVKGRSP